MSNTLLGSDVKIACFYWNLQETYTLQCMIIAEAVDLAVKIGLKKNNILFYSSFKWLPKWGVVIHLGNSSPFEGDLFAFNISCSQSHKDVLMSAPLNSSRAYFLSKLEGNLADLCLRQ